MPPQLCRTSIFCIRSFRIRFMSSRITFPSTPSTTWRTCWPSLCSASLSLSWEKQRPSQRCSEESTRGPGRSSLPRSALCPGLRGRSRPASAARYVYPEWRTLPFRNGEEVSNWKLIFVILRFHCPSRRRMPQCVNIASRARAKYTRSTYRRWGAIMRTGYVMNSDRSIMLSFSSGFITGGTILASLDSGKICSQWLIFYIFLTFEIINEI